jgi:uncharacterized protein (TIGR00266 family)
MAGTQWYLAIGGQQVGPISEDEVISSIRSKTVDGNTLVFTAGMTNWTPLKEVPQLAAHLGGAPAAQVAAPPAAATTLAAAPAGGSAAPGGRQAHEIEFKLHGNEMQFVELFLDPGESAIAEAGGMMFMSGGIQMETVFGDGSRQAGSGGLMGALLGAGKRLLTGESLFMTVFSNTGGRGIEKVAFAAPYPGKILPMDLSKLGGTLICQKDSFLCAAKGVSVGIAFQKKIGVGLFGGEGFIMQKLEGDGMVFAHAGGTVQTYDLAAGETLRVDTGCLVALTPSVNYDVQFVGGIKTAIFGGEGLFFATLTGPGKVWLQSLPLSRLADRIYKAIPGIGKGGKEEGSVLGGLGLGGIIGGDN